MGINPGTSLGALALLGICVPLPAQEKPSEAKPFAEFGIEERVRSEDWDNVLAGTGRPDFRTQYRFRTRVWGQFNIGSKLEIVAGINNENRKITRPDMAYNGRQFIIETLYANYTFNPDWSVRVGRQNLQRGEGFILLEGNPSDGSRSFYFNAMDLTRNFGNSKLEFLAISNPGLDKYLPRLNDPAKPADRQRLCEWDEQALGLYYTNKAWKDATVEAYYFFKTELHDSRSPTNPLYQPNRHISTLGLRSTRAFGDGWSASGEFATQWGVQDARPTVADTSRDINAWGGYLRGKKSFAAPWKPSASLGFIALSGSDPNSQKIGAWDPLFSRYPKWSEIYLYSLVPEKGVGYWSNNRMWEAEFRCTPWPPLDLRATYYHMTAFHAAAPTTPGVFGTGTNRGDIYEIRADVKITKDLKSHAVYEHLSPGDFYATRNGAYFLRFELIYTYKKAFK